MKGKKMSQQDDLIEQDIQAYLKQHENKEMIRVFTCGSVDDGKSTLIGRLLHDSKMIFEDQLAAITKDSKLRTSFRDMIIGLFSVEEYSEYLVNASALNKRMTGIVKERLISHVQVLSQSAPIK
jgi:ribosome biogenesis GTPase A